MCGISGIVSLAGSAVRRAEIEAQIKTMMHRGPDLGAVFLSEQGRCGLGIRRLSIIDVAHGRQPLHNEDHTVHLVYNGETYNHTDLRSDLVRLGHRPASGSDAEAVLHGYEAWGLEGMLRQLRGMFAFALWDENTQTLVLARDRFGIKPLYYGIHAGRLFFASEIKAILSDTTFPRRVNPQALQAMLTLGFVPGPATMFEGIYKLPAAHYMTIRNGQIERVKFWELTFEPGPAITEAAAVEQFLDLLRQSVQVRLMSEVPLGALLSGGLDSGTLVALMERQMQQPLKTVSIGFEHPDYDEAGRALALARTIGTDHRPVTFSKRDFDIYPQVMWHLEEPQCSATAVPIYRLYQNCRKAGLTVVLTGEGADELLGGYHWHQGDALARPLLGLPQPVRQLLALAPLPVSPAARRVLRHGARNLPDRYRHWLEIPDEGYRSRLFAGRVKFELEARHNNPLLAGWGDYVSPLPGIDPFHQLLWLDTQTRLVDFINFEVDKMSMASSIEARVPFLDHRLWEYVASLPPDLKLRGRTGKYLLRQATRSLLPEATRTRVKKGLAAPYAAWLQSERLPDWAEAALSPEEIKRMELFDPLAVTQLRRAVRAGQGHLGALLMGVLSSQVWADIFINGNRWPQNHTSI